MRIKLYTKVPNREACFSRRRSAVWIALIGCFSLLSIGCESESHSATVVELNGAGSSFPTPLYERWFSQMTERSPELRISYEEVGSGAGVQQFVDELVDFAASDDPLTDGEIAQVDSGVCQMPMTSGAIVLAYNLDDVAGNPVTELRLSRKALAGIFLGQIRSWTDDEIQRHNPDLELPDSPIQVEYRLDASGTTSALTRYLSEISSEWREGPGIGKSIHWPVGAGMPKDSGVARGLNQVPGSIGYLSYAFAKSAKLPMAILENKSGAFVTANLDSIQSGLSGLQWSISESHAFIIDPVGEGAYPIVTYSWILCYRMYEDPEKLAKLKELIAYGLKDGQRFSSELGYVALADGAVQNSLSVLDSMTLPQSADSATSMDVSVKEATEAVNADRGSEQRKQPEPEKSEPAEETDPETQE